MNVGYTVSSSLETSLGIEMGLALALNLPNITLPVGLASAGLLDADITDDPLLPNKGYITPRKIEVNKNSLTGTRPIKGTWYGGIDELGQPIEPFFRIFPTERSFVCLIQNNHHVT